MKKLNLIYLVLFILIVIVTQKSIAYSSYPSIYQYINYKTFYNPEPLIKNGTVFISNNGYVVESTTFKAFMPKGAKRISFTIYFVGWEKQMCYTGVTIQYWIGDEPSEKGTVFNDLWDGKYLEITAYSENNVLLIPAKNFEASEKAEWIYCKMNISCPASYCMINSSYELDLKKYSTWYNEEAKWELNGDPLYDTIAPTPKITISVSPTTVTEEDTITYTISLDSENTSVAGLSIPYTLSGSGVLPTPKEGTITVPVNSRTGTLTLKIDEDSNTNDETLTIKLGPLSGYTLPDLFSITIKDNDTTIEPEKYVVDIAPVENAFKINSSEESSSDGTIIIKIDDQNINNGTKDSGQFEIAYYLVKNSAEAPTIANIKSLEKVLLQPSRIVTNIIANNGTETITDSEMKIPAPRFFFDDAASKFWIVKLIDQNNTLKESNDNNNIASFGHIFKLPDFYVEKVEVNNTDVTLGESLTVTATIGNAGTISGKNVKIDFYIVGGDDGDAAVKPFLKNKNENVSNKTGWFAEFPQNGNQGAPTYTGISKTIEELSNESKTTEVTATIQKESYEKYLNKSCRILAFVNSKFEIPESNSFNNFAKKDDFNDADTVTVTWKDISGASDPVNIVPATPILSLGEVKFKSRTDDTQLTLNKFLPEDKVTIECQIKNDGADFTGSPTTSITVYLSEDNQFDVNQDQEISIENELKITSTISKGDKKSESVQFNITDKHPDKYYVFLVLKSGEKKDVVISTSTPLEMDIMKIFTHKVVFEEITDKTKFSNAPVYLGDMVSGGSEGVLHSELKIKFPAYSEKNSPYTAIAVDHYAAFVNPAGSFFFIKKKSESDTDSNKSNRLTYEALPYFEKTTESIVESIFSSTPINIYNDISDASMKGKWSVYWLTVPSASVADKNNLNNILSTKDYEWGTYTFEIK